MKFSTITSISFTFAPLILSPSDAALPPTNRGLLRGSERELRLFGNRPGIKKGPIRPISKTTTVATTTTAATKSTTTTVAAPSKTTTSAATTTAKATTTSSTSNGVTEGGHCTSNMPTDGTNAVQISFFRNPYPENVQLGDDCPVDCVDPIKVSWYPIDQGDNYCYQWPSNFGRNSMNYGTCNVDEGTFSYSQWTNCECSGEPGAIKTVPVTKCVVDRPNSLCQMVTDYSACN